MRVRFLQTVQGSPDGRRTETYEAGEIYDLPLRLAHIFMREGRDGGPACEPAGAGPGETTAAPPEETKADGLTEEAFTPAAYREAVERGLSDADFDGVAPSGSRSRYLVDDVVVAEG